MLAILTAMVTEEKAVLELVDVKKSHEIAGCTLTYGKLEHQDVVVCRSGVGKVMASMATSIVCMEAKPDMVIDLGVAGGLMDSMHVLDTIIGKTVVQVDYDTSPLDGEAGLGISHKADEASVLKAEEILEKMEVPYRTGLIATQDLFMSRNQDYAKLMKNFPESACSEMEGGAVAAVAEAFNIPFLVIRSLSDVVHHEGNPMEFSRFAKIASYRAARFVQEWCKAQNNK